MYAPDSYELLRNAGLDFTRHEEFGIHPNDFAELMITSGLVLSEEVKWITYHRSVTLFCGYIFALNVSSAVMTSDISSKF